MIKLKDFLYKLYDVNIYIVDVNYEYIFTGAVSEFFKARQLDWYNTTTIQSITTFGDFIYIRVNYDKLNGGEFV